MDLLSWLGKSSLRGFLPSPKLLRCKNLEATFVWFWELGYISSFYCSLHSAWLLGSRGVKRYQYCRSCLKSWKKLNFLPNFKSDPMALWRVQVSSKVSHLDSLEPESEKKQKNQHFWGKIFVPQASLYKDPPFSNDKAKILGKTLKVSYTFVQHTH